MRQRGRWVTVVALAGWAMAALALTAGLRAHLRLARRMEAVARACHEVRGPLTAVGLGVSLGARPGGISPARLHAIETEIDRAALAIEDLVAVSRPRPRPVSSTLDRVSMADLITDVVIAAEGRAAHVGMIVEGRWEGPDAVVWAERLRLAQALGNLVTNALEHGAGTVRVRGSARGTAVHLEVVDDGPGLPAPVSELVRRPRAGRGARGRGLAIASSIVRRYGGTLTTAPTAGGAVFMLTLPAVVAA
jgi:signal transduction histidine kinase